MARTTYEYAPGIGIVRTKDQRLIEALGLTPIARNRFGSPVRETETFERPTFRPRQPMTRAQRNRKWARYDKLDKSTKRARTAAFRRCRDDAATWGATDNTPAPEELDSVFLDLEDETTEHHDWQEELVGHRLPDSFQPEYWLEPCDGLDDLQEESLCGHFGDPESEDWLMLEPGYDGVDSAYWSPQSEVVDDGAYERIGGAFAIRGQYGFSAVFGEGYLSGNRGFRVTDRP